METFADEFVVERRKSFRTEGLPSGGAIIALEGSAGAGGDGEEEAAAEIGGCGETVVLASTTAPPPPFTFISAEVSVCFRGEVAIATGSPPPPALPPAPLPSAAREETSPRGETVASGVRFFEACDRAIVRSIPTLESFESLPSTCEGTALVYDVVNIDIIPELGAVTFPFEKEQKPKRKKRRGRRRGRRKKNKRLTFWSLITIHILHHMAIQVTAQKIPSERKRRKRQLSLLRAILELKFRFGSKVPRHEVVRKLWQKN